MATKNKTAEELQIEACAYFLATIPIFELTDPAMINSREECFEHWSDSEVGRRQTANYFKITFLKEIKSFIKEQENCFVQLVEK